MQNEKEEGNGEEEKIRCKQKKLQKLSIFQKLNHFQRGKRQDISLLEVAQTQTDTFLQTHIQARSSGAGREKGKWLEDNVLSSIVLIGLGVN